MAGFLDLEYWEWGLGMGPGTDLAYHSEMVNLQSREQSGEVFKRGIMSVAPTR